MANRPSLRLLNALQYPHSQSVNINDESTFRKVVAWLEENKIQKCKVNMLQNLKNVNSRNWPQVFKEYKMFLGCPEFNTTAEDLQWLLGYAVQLETNNHRNVYQKHATENLKSKTAPTIVAENVLDRLDFQSKEFTQGINAVAKVLKITPHPDPLVTLRAVCKVTTRRLSESAIAKPEDIIVKGKPFPYNEADLGFDLNDRVLNQAAKILRLLYIHDLRELQTRANELIVSVQNVTANPKTDTKLGKVGMK